MPTNRFPTGATIAVLGLLAGCESPGPANPIPPREERDALADALGSVAREHDSRHALQSAGPRGRWSDVLNAIRWAIAEEGVEMGLLATHELVDGYVFDLVTVEGWPATLTVRQVEGEGVYEAAAQVGRFPDVVDRSDREAALLRAFEGWMADLGAKPQPVAIDPDSPR